jgi:DNA-binding response OmpR family regulator
MFRSHAAGAPPPYVAKPFTAEVLLARVREVLDGPGSPPVRG